MLQNDHVRLVRQSTTLQSGGLKRRLYPLGNTYNLAPVNCFCPVCKISRFFHIGIIMFPYASVAMRTRRCMFGNKTIESIINKALLIWGLLEQTLMIFMFKFMLMGRNDSRYLQVRSVKLVTKFKKILKTEGYSSHHICDGANFHSKNNMTQTIMKYCKGIKSIRISRAVHQFDRYLD